MQGKHYREWWGLGEKEQDMPQAKEAATTRHQSLPWYDGNPVLSEIPISQKKPEMLIFFLWKVLMLKVVAINLNL